MKRRRSRTSERGLTAVEAAVLFAIVGSLAAVAVPAFVRELRASRFVEPVEGLQKIGAGALAYAEGRDPAPSPAAAPSTLAFPASAPLTPPSVPRGTREVDPPGVWDHPTWKALAFRAAPEGVPHAFAFSFDASRAGARSSFVARAHGDLDADGVQSTFEIKGHAQEGEKAALEPGMYVESEVE
jgi:hypothetical protein